MPDPTRILVTGVAGFIGMHVAKRLLAEGHAVLGIDDLNAYYDPRLKDARLADVASHPGFRFERINIAESEKVGGVFSAFKPNIVVHLAAQAGVRYSVENPKAYLDANLAGFLAMIEAARHNPPRHFLYASSSSVYGANTKVPFAETDAVDHPVSLYAATKRANEMMAEVYAHLYAIPMTGLRFFTVYGPWGRPDMAPWKFAEAILDERPIDVYDEAAMLRDFTYIDDVAEAILRLIPLVPVREGVSPAHRIVNIGNHKPERLADFIAAIETACGKAAIKRHLPRQPGDVPVTCADNDRLHALTGFRPSITIESGLARFVAWLAEWRAGQQA